MLYIPMARIIATYLQVDRVSNEVSIDHRVGDVGIQLGE